MRILFTIFAAVLLTACLIAQSPEKMSYQAVIRNASNNLVTITAIGMKISVLQGTTNGTPVYVETQNPTTNANGLVSIEIGEGTILSGDFAAINWSNGPYYIKTEIDPTGGTAYTITGISQLLSVPYAMYAKTSGSSIPGPKGDKGDQGDPGVAIDDAQTLTNKTWSSSKINTDLSIKVDKIAGKGLSTHDYTTTEQTKLAGIATGAEVNINADWNATSGDAQIFNKPINIDEDKTDDVTTTGNQTISGNKTFTGVTSVPSPVNPDDAATKAYVDALMAYIEVLNSQIEPSLVANGFIDPRDGNQYKVARIGNQLWMAENLKYLPSVSVPGTRSNTIPYYYVYGYYDTVISTAKAMANYTTYGVLYNWPAAMAGSSANNSNPSGIHGVCPVGWHLPSEAEWVQLTDYLGDSTAGGKLKEVGTTHWTSPNTGATNESGFTALPGGLRNTSGNFSNNGDRGYWWSTTAGYRTGLSNYASYLSIYYSSSYFYNNEINKESGFSVRCVRD